MMSSGGFLRHRLVEVGLQAVALAVDDALGQPLQQRQLGQLGRPGLFRRRRRHALEQRHQLLQRVVFVAAPVVDQVQRHLALLVGDPVHRQDLRSVHDRRIQPGLLAFVQEHRVEHLARGGIEPERDVGKPQRGLHVRVASLQLADGLDGLDAVLARLLLPGGDGEGQTVDENGRFVDAPVAGDVGDQPLGDLDLLLAVRAWPSSSMVSATTAAPCSATSSMVLWNRDSGPSPSS